MERIVVEIFSSMGIRQDIKVFDAAEISIGRDYTNQLILSDPYVSEKHLTLRVGEEGWVIEDLNSKNGIFLKGKRMTNPFAIKSGDVIVIGRTYLRFLSPQHPVGSALRLAINNGLFRFLSNGWGTLGCVLLAFGFGLCDEYFSTFQKIQFGKLFAAAIFLIVIIFIWSGIWAFIGRVIKHSSQFAFQLSLASLVLVGMIIIFPVASWIGYNFSSILIEIIIYCFLFGGLFASLLYGNLAIATHISHRWRLIFSGLIACVLIGIVWLGFIASRSNFNPVPPIYTTLEAPIFKIAPDQSIDQFIKDSHSVFEARTKNKK